MTTAAHTMSGSPRARGGVPHLARAFALAGSVSAAFLAVGGARVYSNWDGLQRERALYAARLEAHTRLLNAPPLAVLPVIQAAHGRDLFLATCAACHSPEGTGIAGLGRDLTRSWFIAASDDSAMHSFLLQGRPNGRPVAMPPKGGNPELQDSDLNDIVVYLRGLQDSRRMPELPPPTMIVAAATDAEKAQALAAADGDTELAAYIASGNKLFHSSCVACHGPSGVGITGNGKPLVKNEFIKSLTDDQLLAFITQGRGPADPKNTTGIQMPPKGGNPAMSEDDILDVISYLRTLQRDPGGSPATVSNK